MKLLVVLFVSLVLLTPFFCLLVFLGAEPINPGHRPVKGPLTPEHLSSVGLEAA